MTQFTISQLVPLSFPKCFLLVLLKEAYLKESHVSAIPVPRYKPAFFSCCPLSCDWRIACAS